MIVFIYSQIDREEIMLEEYRGKRYNKIIPSINNIGNVYAIVIENDYCHIIYYIQVIGIANYRIQSGKKYSDIKLTQNLEVGLRLPTPIIDAEYLNTPHIIDSIIGYDEDNEYLFGQCTLKPE